MSGVPSCCGPKAPCCPPSTSSSPASGTSGVKPRVADVSAETAEVSEKILAELAAAKIAIEQSDEQKRYGTDALETKKNFGLIGGV